VIIICGRAFVGTAPED